jgi:pyridoxine 4-dehydrogenase
MQLAGLHVFCPPADRDAAIAVLREAVRPGITHIDTSDYYGPHVTSQISRKPCNPYPDGLRIVTKIGALRDAEPFTVLAEMQDEGLIKHLGLSTVSASQITGAQSIAPIVCVQNFYNLAHRDEDDLIDFLAGQGIAYVPYFPLGGFAPLQSEELSAVATRLDGTPIAVALAWLLRRSPNILLIPGTSSVAHLRENVGGAALTLPEDELAKLNSMAS